MSAQPPLVLDVPDGGRLLSRAFQDSGFCVVGGPELIFGQDMQGWRPPAGRFDGVIGGPPCQVHSVASNITGTAAVDLIPEWCEIVIAAQPTWWLMENVPGAPIPEIDGYRSNDYQLDRRSLGIPKHRQRRFTFGFWVNEHAPHTATQTVARWYAAMAEVLPVPSWSLRWFPTHPLDPPPADCTLQTALVASDCNRGSPNRAQPDRGTEGVAGWIKHKLQPALLASDGKHQTSLRGKSNQTIKGWIGGKLTVELAWAAQELPGEPPEEWDKGRWFTKAGQIRLLGNGVPYSMGRHVARAVCLALGMADPGNVVRWPKNSLLEEPQGAEVQQ